jgi:hypothetical protein
MSGPGDSNVRAAKLAVEHRMVSAEVAERILGLLESRRSEVKLPELLQSLGHLSEEQRKQLETLLMAATRPGAAAGEDPQRFGAALIARGLASASQVAEALKEQAQLAAKGVFKNLGELLVTKGVMTAIQVRTLLGERDRRIMACPLCGEKYNVPKGRAGEAKCPADGSPLGEAQRSASVGVAASLAGESASESPIGMEFGGCKIIELIGRGSMGAVYQAKHVGLNRYVAIKLLPSLSNDPERVKRLLFEARAIAKLEHPNIVQVYDVGFHRGYFFIVMQLLKGETLEDRMLAMGALPRDLALDVVREVAQGLAAAHQRGIVHRDLKPANVMLTEDGHARLTDFGLAQDSEHPDQHEGMIVGTPFYMSPEQWLGHKADERSDLYALGVILYQMVTGQRPFQGDTVNELMHQHLKVPAPNPKAADESLPDGLCAMLKKMMAKPPKKRYANVPEFLQDLARAAAGEETEALAEFGTQVRCGFCEAFNPVSEKKCKVCSEPLQESGGPLEIAARPDEFKCPGCGGLNRKGSRACGGCGRGFCTRCRQRNSVLRGLCHQCMPHLRRR